MWKLFDVEEGIPKINKMTHAKNSKRQICDQHHAWARGKCDTNKAVNKADALQLRRLHVTRGGCDGMGSIGE